MLPKNFFSLGTLGKSAPVAKATATATKTAPTKSAAKSAPAKGKKDMTWGGRPDPTPEMIIDPNGAVDVTKEHWKLGWKN